MSGRCLVGIDLGTTNTVLATAEIRAGAVPRVVPLAQLVDRGQVAEERLLPSVLFAPPEGETEDDPWGDAPFVVGKLARRRGEATAGRAVVSAKSWLCHAEVDRLSPILPWGADPELPAAFRVSPVDASRRILAHVVSAARGSLGDLREQEIVLTVPASFDQVARELTLRAAREAGLSVRLLEEPLAAFHDFLAQRGTETLGALLDGTGRNEARILVVDVGGGTTDLTLVRVRRPGSELAFDRVAVGRHVLLGGDNMDLSLAHIAESRLSPGDRLPAAQFAELVQAARAAKERLLARDAPESAEVRLLPRGSALVGSVLRTTFERDEVLSLVLDGFFPDVGRDERPARKRSGLVAFGLRYERDPAITRHVAEFVSTHVAEGRGPDAVLLNGGVFHAEAIVERLFDWFSRAYGRRPVHLRATDPDVAVARGAVAYGLALHGHGVRIGGGSPRSYFIGLSPEKDRARAVCVVPRGSLEGDRHVVVVPGLSLVVGEPVRFDLLSADRGAHAPGDVVTVDDSLDSLPSLVASFDAGDQRRGSRVPVELEGELGSVGTLDLACVETAPREDGARARHRLAFDLRAPTARPSVRPLPSTRPKDPKLVQAEALVESAFGPGRADADPRTAKHLVRELERILGERATWTTETTRALFDVLAKEPRARKRSADHERVFWMLAGFCLRPGYGHPKDGDRVGKLVPLFPELLQFGDEARNQQQFFIAFRRVSGGLLEPAQTRVRDLLDPFLSTDTDTGKKKKGFKPLARDEMLSLAAALERLPPERRAALGRWILERTWTDRDPRLWTALAHVGARMPTYASAHHVVPAPEASRWLDHLLREKWNEVPTAGRAAATIARFTGDRTRDVSDSLREQVAKRLEATHSPAEWILSLREVVPLVASDSSEFFGESLPVGLVLSDENRD
ncbi:MAG TPA: Hsp70 family protein [Polyangiaceae bacterium]|nr:Hsp70 family protein [Polyangiaceae bacterium]